MPRSVKLDLRGSPPVSGGTRDRIPPGRYRVRVEKIEETTSRSGKKMWTNAVKVSAGEKTGSNLGDNFVLVDNNNQPSKMGLGRLHHFLLCLGLPVKEAVINLDLDNLSGRECEVDVQDEDFTDNSGNSRTSSAIKNYFPIRANGSSPAAEASLPVEIPQPASESVETQSESVAGDSSDAEEVAIEIDDLFK